MSRALTIIDRAIFTMGPSFGLDTEVIEAEMVKRGYSPIEGWYIASAESSGGSTVVEVIQV